MTLQEKYNALTEGAFPKHQFLRDARLAFPQIISQFNSCEDAAKILKNRGVIAEVEKKVEPVKHDPADSISPNTLNQGIKAELELKGLDTQNKPSEEEYTAAKKKAVKNITKDSLHYKNAKTMASSKSDKMEKVKMNESAIKIIKHYLNESKLAEEMVVGKQLQDIMDSDSAKVAQGAAIALDALKKFYAASENLTRKLEKAYKTAGSFMAPALGAAVVKQISDITSKPMRAEMPKAKMVNIAKIDDFEGLSKETGISVADLKAMQRELKSGTMALPRANERQETSLATLMETNDKSNVMKEGEDMYVNGKQVDPMTIELDKDDFGNGLQWYPISARFLDGSILDDNDLEILEKEYFENDYVEFSDYYDYDSHIDSEKDRQWDY